MQKMLKWVPMECKACIVCNFVTYNLLTKKCQVCKSTRFAPFCESKSWQNSKNDVGVIIKFQKCEVKK